MPPPSSSRLRPNNNNSRSSLKINPRHALLVAVVIYFAGLGLFLRSSIATTVDHEESATHNIMASKQQLPQDRVEEPPRSSQHHGDAATIDYSPPAKAVVVVKKNPNVELEFTVLHNPNPKVTRQKQKRFKPHELKLPTPILVMGLMKAGTTSILSYFKCGMDGNATQFSHYDCMHGGGYKDPSKIGMACGKHMRRNIEKDHKPAFHGMDQFDVYAELDAQELSGGMTLPQWRFVQEIHDHFPNATWILNLRNPRQWLDSVDRWKDLRQRFVDNPYYPGFVKGKGQTDDEMFDFYNRQAQRIRDFVRDHPSHTLVEVPIDRPEAGQILEDAFGISHNECWGNRNVNNGTAVWVER